MIPNVIATGQHFRTNTPTSTDEEGQEVIDHSHIISFEDPGEIRTSIHLDEAKKYHAAGRDGYYTPPDSESDVDDPPDHFWEQQNPPPQRQLQPVDGRTSNQTEDVVTSQRPNQVSNHSHPVKDAGQSISTYQKSPSDERRLQIEGSHLSKRHPRQGLEQYQNRQQLNMPKKNENGRKYHAGGGAAGDACSILTEFAEYENSMPHRKAEVPCHVSPARETTESDNYRYLELDSGNFLGSMTMKAHPLLKSIEFSAKRVLVRTLTDGTKPLDSSDAARRKRSPHIPLRNSHAKYTARLHCEFLLLELNNGLYQTLDDLRSQNPFVSECAPTKEPRPPTTPKRLVTPLVKNEFGPPNTAERVQEPIVPDEVPITPLTPREPPEMPQKLAVPTKSERPEQRPSKISAAEVPQNGNRGFINAGTCKTNTKPAMNPTSSEAAFQRLNAVYGASRIPLSQARRLRMAEAMKIKGNPLRKIKTPVISIVNAVPPPKSKASSIVQPVSTQLNPVNYSKKPEVIPSHKVPPKPGQTIAVPQHIVRKARPPRPLTRGYGFTNVTRTYWNPAAKKTYTTKDNISTQNLGRVLTAQKSARVSLSDVEEVMQSPRENKKVKSWPKVTKVIKVRTPRKIRNQPQFVGVRKQRNGN